MKQIYTLIAIALGAFALTGCTADELAPIAPEGDGTNAPVTIVASLNAPTTRTGHDENDANDLNGPIKVTWAAGDKFVIHSIGKDGNLVANGTAIFDLVADDAGKYSGKFTGAAAPVAAFYYDILCPSTVPPLNESGVLNFSLVGQKQIGNNSLAHLSAVDVMSGYMVTKDDYTQISFVAGEGHSKSGHLAALMTFDLSNIPADLGEPQRIVLGAINVDGPVKDFYDNLAGEDGVIAGTHSTVNTLTLDLENVTAANGKIKAYMMMAPATIFEDESLTITLEGSNKSYTFTSPELTNGKEYKAGWRYVAKVDTWAEITAASPIEYDGTAQASATFGGGDGTGDHGSATNPYLISTAGELQKLIDDVNNVNGGNNYKDVYFKLTQDINITAATWPAIGNGKGNGNKFAGIFDGNGHTLSGTMTAESDQQGFGFFGYTEENAVITNLHSSATVTGTEYVGSIVGYAQGKSVISNCTTKSGATVSGKGDTGGIVGYTGSGSIIGCSNAAAVLGDSEKAGGILGGASATSVLVSGCYNTGTITTSGIFKGAIAGLAGTLKCCRYLSVGDIKAAGSQEDTYARFTDVSSSADEATLNGVDAIAALNLGIADWNTANPTKPAVLSFFKGATLPVLVPPTTNGGAIGGIGDSGSAWQ